MRPHFRGWRRLIAALSVASVVSGVSAMAQDQPPMLPDEPVPAAPAVSASDAALQQILERLERIERENLELRNQLNQQSGSLAQQKGDLEAQRADIAQQRSELAGQKSALDDQNRELRQQSERLGQEAQFREASLSTMAAEIAAEKATKPAWGMSWNNGLEFATDDKAFKVHIGGRTQIDAIFLNSEAGALNGAGGVGAQDSVNFRRARLRMDGTMYELIDYAAEYDFTNTVTDINGQAGENQVSVSPAPTDLWFTFKEVPLVGNIRVGQHKPAIGWEHLTSSRFLPFLERSYAQDLFGGPFDNGFAPGISAFNTWDDEHGTWNVGVYKQTANIFGFNTGDGEYNVTGRLTRILLEDTCTHEILHAGLSGSWRDPDQNRVRYRTRGSLRNGPPGALNPTFADTGLFSADSQYIVGTELVYQNGRFSTVGEWLGSWTDGSAGFVGGVSQPTDQVLAKTWHVDVMYFLTDDHFEYEKKTGVFGRMVPHENASWKGGCFRTGAWQVVGRFCQADLDQSGLRGGVADDWTAGLNWYLNPNSKLQWNYTVSVINNNARGVDDGTVTGFGMRFAHDF